VTWRDTRNGRDDIYFNRSPDGGATWLIADVRLDTDPMAFSFDKLGVAREVPPIFGVLRRPNIGAL
jgi:hypothetical protein